MAKLKIALAKDPYQPETICNENGEATTSDEEALEVLLKKLIDKLITPERVRWAIQTFKPFKSSGIDKIIPALIKESDNSLIQTLVSIYRAILTWAYIPKAWQEVKVIFIPKPGKQSYDKADAYRPISLTSILLKVMMNL